MQRKTPDVLRLLVKLGADVNAKGPSEASALSYSSSKGHCESMQVLLELGADPVSLTIGGGSPLHMAARSSEARSCQMLVEHITEASGTAAATAALLAKDNQGKNPLHWAATESRGSGADAASCMSTLLRLLGKIGGAQVVESALRETVGEKEQTLVYLAAKDERDECFGLLAQMTEGTRIALEVLDKDGLTPVALARQVGIEFENLPAFAQVTFPPCCMDISEAIKSVHIVCLRRLLRGRETAKGVAGHDRDTTRALAGRNSSPSAFDGPREEGDPLASIVHGNHFFKVSSSCSRMVRLLLDAGFSPDGCHADGAPLRCSTDAAEYGNYFCAACTLQLVDAGARGFFKFEGDDFLSCPMDPILDNATDYCKSQELFRKVLSACHLAEDDVFGVTDLYRRAGHNVDNFDVEKALVEAGVDILTKDDEGRTSLHMLVGMLNYIYGGDYDGDNPPRVDESDGLVEAVEWLVSKVSCDSSGTLLECRAYLALFGIMLHEGSDPSVL